MNKTFRTLALTAGIAFSGALAGGQPAQAGSEVSTLTVTGTGMVEAAPDQAYFSFGVHSTGLVAADAMTENKEAMARAFNALRSRDVPAEDIRTTGLSLTPRYQNRQANGTQTAPRIAGYEAHNTVTVTIDEISRLGEVLDSLVSAGVNGIDQVSYGISDSSALEAEARADAARTARAKAEAYAEAIGTEITGILSISEQGGRIAQPMMRMEAMAMTKGSSIPVAGGTQSVSAGVTVVFELSGDLDQGKKTSAVRQ